MKNRASHLILFPLSVFYLSEIAILRWCFEDAPGFKSLCITIWKMEGGCLRLRCLGSITNQFQVRLNYLLHGILKWKPSHNALWAGTVLVYTGAHWVPALLPIYLDIAVGFANLSLPTLIIFFSSSVLFFPSQGSWARLVSQPALPE